MTGQLYPALVSSDCPFFLPVLSLLSVADEDDLMNGHSALACDSIDSMVFVWVRVGVSV